MVSKPLREKGFHLHVKDHLAHLFSDFSPTKVGKISRVSKFIRKNRTLSFRFFHLILLFWGYAFLLGLISSEKFATAKILLPHL